MRLKKVTIWCLFLVLGIQSASAYFKITSRYLIACLSDLAFEACELILFKYFELDQEPLNTSFCVKALEEAESKFSIAVITYTIKLSLNNTKSDFINFLSREPHNLEDIRVFVSPCDKDLREATIKVSPNHMTRSEFINFLSSNFRNLEQIGWELCNCPPYIQLLGSFKNLSRLELIICNNLTICGDFNSNNEIQIEIQRTVETEKNIILQVEQLLRGLENFLDLEFLFSNQVTEVQVPQRFFQGLTNLSLIRFENCNITKLSKEHFEDLDNLQTLSFKGGAINDFDWLNSTTIQSKLNILELNLDVQMPNSNISAFICRNSVICDFNVDINKKPCPDGCRCFLYRSDNTFVIECELHDYKRKIPELPIPIIGSTSLTFESTYLTELPNLTLYGYSNLRELHVANNDLSSLTLDQLPPNLTLLDIEHNQFEFIDYKVLEYLLSRSGKMKMRLSENPWECYCDDFHLLEFINRKSEDIVIGDLDDLMCYKDNLALLMPWKLEDACKSYLLYYILGSLLGLAVVIITFLLAKKSIVMWLYERNLCLKWISRPEPKVDTVLTIDAFLAFSHVDLELIKEYLEKLEKGPREYRLVFYQRDWKIGESIPDCILQSIEQSKRVIILMTNSFVRSSWGMFEFRSAIKATSMDKEKRLIVILYPDVDLDELEPELKRYMKYNTYLRRDDPLFWRKLLYAMPHKQPVLTDCPAIEAN